MIPQRNISDSKFAGKGKRKTNTGTRHRARLRAGMVSGWLGYNIHCAIDWLSKAARHFGVAGSRVTGFQKIWILP